MKRILFYLFSILMVGVWCTSGFTTEIVGPGGSPYTSEVTGNAAGYDIHNGGGAWTLDVNAGDNIFTNNSSGGNVTNSLLGAIDTDNASLTNVVFAGSSNVFGTIGSTAKFEAISATGGPATTVNFYGTVNATTYSIATGTMNFLSGTSNNGAANFTGDGTVGLAANTTVVGALTTGTADTGTLSLASGSAWNGAIGGGGGLKSINVVGGSNTAGVTAAQTGAGAVSTHAMSLGTNELDLGGALTFANNSTINTTLASPTVYGHAVVTGASNLGTGLAVDVTVPSTSLIRAGNQFNIIQSTSGTGALATVVNDPTNPLYTFSIVTTAAGYAAIQSSFVPLQVPIGSSGPAAPVATVLVSITNPSADLSTVITAINALNTAAAVINAENQLSPLTPALVAPKVTFEGAREFQDLWLSRLDMCDQFSQYNKDDPTCQEGNPQSGWWAKAFGYFGDQNDNGVFPGYTDIIAGSMIAYDMPIGEDTRAGLGFGYSRSAIDGNNYHTSTYFDSYRPTVYIGHDQGPWFVDGSASFGWNQYAGMRNIEFPGFERTANADYAGQDYTAFLNSGYHIAVPAKFIVTPLLSLQYSRVNMEGYTETGAGDIDLHVKPQGYDFLESGLGAKLERPFSFHSLTFVPDLHFKWLHDFLNPTMQQTAEFQTLGSTSFTTPGLKTSPDTYNAGTGITLLSCNCNKYKWSING